MQPPRLLIVTSEASIRESVERCLRSAGYATTFDVADAGVVLAVAVDRAGARAASALPRALPVVRLSLDADAIADLRYEVGQVRRELLIAVAATLGAAATSAASGV